MLREVENRLFWKMRSFFLFFSGISEMTIFKRKSCFLVKECATLQSAGGFQQSSTLPSLRSFIGSANMFNKGARIPLKAKTEKWANQTHKAKSGFWVSPKGSTFFLMNSGQHLGVSKNSGTPKCMIYNGKPY